MVIHVVVISCFDHYNAPAWTALKKHLEAVAGPEQWCMLPCWTQELCLLCGIQPLQQSRWPCSYLLLARPWRPAYFPQFLVQVIRWTLLPIWLFCLAFLVLLFICFNHGHHGLYADAAIIVLILYHPESLLWHGRTYNSLNEYEEMSSTKDIYNEEMFHLLEIDLTVLQIGLTDHLYSLEHILNKQHKFVLILSLNLHPLMYDGWHLLIKISATHYLKSYRIYMVGFLNQATFYQWDQFTGADTNSLYSQTQN